MSVSRIAATAEATPAKPARYAYADSLKVVLVAGVIVGHITMSWSGIHAWVLEEPPVREPLLTVIKLAAVIGTMFAMALFFLIAGAFTPGSLDRKGLRTFVTARTLRLGPPVVFFCSCSPRWSSRSTPTTPFGIGVPGLRPAHLAQSGSGTCRWRPPSSCSPRT